MKKSLMFPCLLMLLGGCNNVSIRKETLLLASIMVVHFCPRFRLPFNHVPTMFLKCTMASMKTIPASIIDGIAPGFHHGHQILWFKVMSLLLLAQTVTSLQASTTFWHLWSIGPQRSNPGMPTKQIYLHFATSSEPILVNNDSHTN